MAKTHKEAGSWVLDVLSRNLPAINEENHVRHLDSRCFERYYIRHHSECAHLEAFEKKNTCAHMPGTKR